MNSESRDSEAGATESRKREHVDLCISRNVHFQEKTNGLEKWEFEHNALPEIAYSDVDPSTDFLHHHLSMPLLITGMTGGYKDAGRINAKLAEACEHHGVAIGCGSQRQALESSTFHHTYRIIRDHAPSAAVLANIGAVELVRTSSLDSLSRIIDLVEADALAVHVNPLQELMQPEGMPDFRGVLEAIGRAVRLLSVPIIVKEVGAGLGASVVRRLREQGVSWVDLAGAGGTSWAGVELLRSRGEDGVLSPFWDWGIPLARILADLRSEPVDGMHMIASGGITDGLMMAKTLALGADLAGAARPILRAAMTSSRALDELLQQWNNDLRNVMFLTGSRTIADLRTASLYNVD